MPESRRFGDPAKMELEIRWVDDPEPPERRPADYGWSMGQLTIRVAGMNVTATTLGGEQRSHVCWYLGPFLDWLATNWVAVLHEERLPWPSPGSAPAALACNHALDEWMAADDPQGQQHYANVQDWYFRHGVRSAAAGGVFPDLFIRRVADDIEVSWSGRRAPFARAGLAFESGAGVARLAVPDVAEAIWQTLDWFVDHPRQSPAQYQGQIAALCTKVAALHNVGHSALAHRYVHGDVMERVEGAFAAIGRADLLEGDVVGGGAPYIPELPPAVVMFGGVSPDLGTRDVECLRDQLVAAQGGGDSVELSTLVADQRDSALGVPHRDGHRFAAELLEDVTPPDVDFVDVRAMCHELGLTIQEINLETDSIRGAAIAGEGFAPRILVNRTHYFNQNESGMRFTIAHELCHVLFDRTRARRLAHSSGPWAAQGIERRANAFAAHLLMPRALVVKHLPDANRIERDDVQGLASRLQVNDSALLPHLQSLDLLDAASRERLRDEVRSAPARGGGALER